MAGLAASSSSQPPSASDSDPAARNSSRLSSARLLGAVRRDVAAQQGAGPAAPGPARSRRPYGRQHGGLTSRTRAGGTPRASPAVPQPLPTAIPLPRALRRRSPLAGGCHAAFLASARPPLPLPACSAAGRGGAPRPRPPSPVPAAGPRGAGVTRLCVSPLVSPPRSAGQLPSNGGESAPSPAAPPRSI